LSIFSVTLPSLLRAQSGVTLTHRGAQNFAERWGHDPRSWWSEPDSSSDCSSSSSISAFVSVLVRW